MTRHGAIRRLAALLMLAVSGRAARAQGADTTARRPGIERLGAVVQQRLQLTDEQTTRLRETSERYAEQRKALLRDERDARRTVRDEMGRGDAADQARVQGALDRLYAVQQHRSDLAAREQRDLANFLTPTQRAQYAGMQERAFRAAQDIRQRRDAAIGRAPQQPAPDAQVAQNAERRVERQQMQQERRQERRQERQQERQAEQAARRAAARRPH